VIWAKVAVAALAWLTAAPLPQPRTEVGAAVLRGRVVVVGGLTAAGVPSARADALSPATGRWRRLPDLPVAVHHPLVASDSGRVYVAGGYGGRLGAGERLRTVFCECCRAAGMIRLMSARMDWARLMFRSRLRSGLGH